MASVAQLNVTIAARIGQFQRDLRAVETQMRRFSGQMNQIGNTISTSLSLPLLAIGVSAVKAAGEFESLRLSLQATMKDAGYSISQANAEVEKLRKSAMAPGLDFEQAVKASIRLQNVGFTANAARKTIEEFANAIAMGGGSADDLNEITNQFSQMIGKNKILNEDLKIVMARMPKMAGLMKEAFGTMDLEKIRASGISAKEFVERTAEAAAKLGRVQGGIQNSIVNAISAVKQSAAAFGEEINRVFDLSKTSENLSATLEGWVNWFKSLSDTTKKYAIEFGLFLIVLGPAAKIIAGITSVFQSMASVAGMVVGAVKKMSGVVVEAIASFRALDAAMKATVIGAAITVVLAAAAAFYLLYQRTEDARAAQMAINDVMRTAQQSISAERTSTLLLVDVLKDHNSNLSQKQAAIKKLNEISPTYFKGLQAEAIDINALNKSYDAYIESLLKAARVKAGEEKLIEYDKKRLELAERRARISEDTSSSSGKYDNMGVGQNSSMAAQEAAVRAQKIAEIDAEDAAYARLQKTVTGVIKINNGLADANDKSANSSKKLGQVLGKQSEALEAEAKKDKAAQIAATDATDSNTTATDNNVKSKKELREEAAAHKRELKELAKEEKHYSEVQTKAAEEYAKALQWQADATVALKKSQLDRLLYPVTKLSELGKDLRGLLSHAQSSFSPMLDKLTPSYLDKINPFRKAPAYARPHLAPEVLPKREKIEPLLPEEGTTKLEAYKNQLNGISEALIRWGYNNNVAVGGVKTLSEVFKATAEQSASSANDLFGSLMGLQGAYTNSGKAALVAAADIMRAALATAIASAISRSMLTSAHPLLGLALAGIAVAGVNALFGKIKQSLTKDVPKFAKGTSFAPGGMALVGELGPELVNLPRGSQVIPNNKLTAAMSGGGTVVLNPSIHYDATGFRIMLEKEAKRNGRVNG